MAKPVFSKAASKTSSKTPWRLFLLGAALTCGGPLLAGCQPAAPASPSFEADVRPIFMSHCVRCHGAGGTLNQAKAPVEDGGMLNPPVSNVWLDHYADTGACGATADPNNPCQFGALTWALNIEGGIEFAIHVTGTIETMPPPPAPRLDDWELKVVDAWIAEKPTPVCSNSPNPDPTICPPDAGQ
jgi:mono/diheme cytochrome c family protein